MNGLASGLIYEHYSVLRQALQLAICSVFERAHFENPNTTIFLGKLA
jgi:hypothetical protein